MAYIHSTSRDSCLRVCLDVCRTGVSAFDRENIYMGKTIKFSVFWSLHTFFSFISFVYQF